MLENSSSAPPNVLIPFFSRRMAASHPESHRNGPSDTLTGLVLPGSPFPTGMRAHDLILVRR